MPLAQQLGPNVHVPDEHLAQQPAERVALLAAGIREVEAHDPAVDQGAKCRGRVGSAGGERSVTHATQPETLTV